MGFPRPSRKLTPRAFYLEYVPELWQALTSGVEDDTWAVRIGAKIDDAVFGMHARGRELLVEESLPREPHLTFISDVDSFRIAMFDLLPRVLKLVERNLGERTAYDSVETYGTSVSPHVLLQHSGVVDVHYTDDAGDQARVEIRIGSGVGRQAVVRASDADLWTLLGSNGRISQLLKSRVELDGDIAYVIQVAQALEPVAP